MKADRIVRGVAWLRCQSDDRINAETGFYGLKLGQQIILNRLFERWADRKDSDLEFHFFTQEYQGRYRNCFAAILDKHRFYGCRCRPHKNRVYDLAALIAYAKTAKSEQEETILQTCENLHLPILRIARQMRGRS